MIIYKRIEAPGKYHDDNAIPDVVNYITRKDKTEHGYIIGIKVDIQNVVGSMIAVSEHFGKNSRLRLHHFVLAFPKEYSNIEVLAQIAKEVCAYIGTVYQVVAAIHEDRKPGLHIHFVFNAVSYVNGYKFHGSKSDHWEMREWIRSALYRYGMYPLVSVKYRPDNNNPHE